MVIIYGQYMENTKNQSIIIRKTEYNILNVYYFHRLGERLFIGLQFLVQSSNFK